LVSGEDGLEVLRIVEAARLASDEERRVLVEHGVDVREYGQ
jgi:predicted dehydrogenase